MYDKDNALLDYYKHLISDLVPFVETNDWDGLSSHVLEEWTVFEILLLVEVLRKKAMMAPLEKEEIALSDHFFPLGVVRALTAVGWWGAVAGDERDGSPLQMTVLELEQKNAEGKGDEQGQAAYFRSLDNQLKALTALVKSGADAAEAARDAATANGETLQEIKAGLPPPRKPGRPRNGENKPGLTLADAARMTGRAPSTISGWDKTPPEGYPGRDDAAAFTVWWNQTKLNTTTKHRIITAGEEQLEHASWVAAQNGNRQKPTRR